MKNIRVPFHYGSSHANPRRQVPFDKLRAFDAFEQDTRRS